MRGRSVVVTRAGHQAGDLSAALARRGARALSYPCIDIAPPADTATIDAALREGRFDWLILTSANAAQSVRLRCQALGVDALAVARVAAVGPATARIARDALGLTVTAMPDEFSAEALAEALPDVAGSSVLLPQSARAAPALRDRLAARGADVTAIAAYRTVTGRGGVDLPALLRRRAVDAVTFTSPSTVAGCLSRLGSAAPQLARTRIACIGPVTARAARERGLRPAAVPEEHTTEGLVRELERLFNTTRAASFPVVRPRRLRRGAAMRGLVAETTLAPSDLICPLFVREGQGIDEPVASMPGQRRRSPDRLAGEARAIAALGIPAVILFGVPARRDARGSENCNPGGVIAQAIDAVSEAAPELLVISDLCLCEYTDHGHCGVIDAEGEVLNDPTLELLGEAAAVHAGAGADVIAPSGMVDGMVGAIRRSLDSSGHDQVAIMSYAAKYSSAFYGPFRDAAESAPAAGDRSGYQMDPANAREALREVELDVAEGADVVMVKPALPYLDVIRRVREGTRVPLAAYQVSGEFAMVHAAAERGWLDLRRAAVESLTSIKRAGADMVISYFAKDVVGWMDGQ